MNRQKPARPSSHNRVLAASLRASTALSPGQAAVTALNPIEAPQRFGQGGARSPLTRHGRPNT